MTELKRGRDHTEIGGGPLSCDHGRRHFLAISLGHASAPHGAVGRAPTTFGGGPPPNIIWQRHSLARRLGHTSSHYGSIGNGAALKFVGEGP